MKQLNNIDIEKFHNVTQKNNVSIYIKATEAAPEDKELINYALINTYFTDGNIHVLKSDEMPEKNRKLCAVYRY
ncbi:MAG: hypothetical protein R6U11_10400 [Bacteroidales bacterium]